MKKCVAYYRVSTKSQGESGLGLSAQRTIIEYFTSNSDQNEIVASFTDIASGTNTERDELKKAIDICINEGYHLVVAKSDRLSRSVKDALSIYDKLGERLICCDAPNTDKFTLTILYAIAEREALLISLRTKGALEQVKKRTPEEMERLGKKPIGREKGCDTKKATQAGIKARQKKRDKLLKNAFITAEMMRRNGAILKDIAIHLNKIGERTTRGNVFTPSTVRIMLETVKVYE